jgi:hypothetical protein
MHEHPRVPGPRPALPLRAVVAISAAAFELAPAALRADALQAGVGEVIDDRFSAGMLTGGLRVELSIEGDGKDKVKAAR